MPTLPAVEMVILVDRAAVVPSTNCMLLFAPGVAWPLRFSMNKFFSASRFDWAVSLIEPESPPFSWMYWGKPLILVLLTMPITSRGVSGPDVPMPTLPPGMRVIVIFSRPLSFAKKVNL